jgi:hypothetical protein
MPRIEPETIKEAKPYVIIKSTSTSAKRLPTFISPRTLITFHMEIAQT